MSRNWWADRLAAPIPPYTPPPSPPPVAPQQMPQERPGAAPGAIFRPAPPVAPDLCPGCGSDNYTGSPGSQYKRCFDCGYPVVQAGTGVGSVRSEAPVKKTTQVEGGGFNPQQIVGRVE